MELDSRTLERYEDDICIVSLVFGISMFIDAPLSLHGSSVLACVDRVIREMDSDVLKYYATETMSKHKPITKRTFTMLPTWLKPDAATREFVALEIKNGEDYTAAPHHLIKLFGGEKGSIHFDTGDANMLRFALPFEFGAHRTEEALSLFRDLSALMPFRYGTAGFAFLCSPYEEADARAHAWAKAMRYPGIDIFAVEDDCITIGHDGVKGTNWLTFLDHRYIEALGGEKGLREKLPSEIEWSKLKTGFLFRAGSVPATGDTNRREFLPLYRSMFAFLEPLTPHAYARAPDILLDDEEATEKTLSWLRRFADV